MCESFVTIVADDISSIEALVLCNSLKQTGTEKLISVLINPSVSYHLKNVLMKSFDRVFCLKDLYVISDGRNRFDVSGDYEKLKCWLLTDFTKCVFLESDVLVVENIDDLFDRLELSAVSDPKWPDCFDAGVFVFQPCFKTYKQLIDYSISNPTPDNSFQCLLNMFFCDWNIISMERKIPFIYNCQMNASFYTHTPAIIHFGHCIKAARMGHSIFNLMHPDSSAAVKHETWSRLWSLWWKIFNEMVKPALDNNETLRFKRTGCDYGDQLESEQKRGLDQSHGCSDQKCSSSNSYLECQNTTYKGCSHEEGCQNQSIGYSPKMCNNHNSESICPSQDFCVDIESISQEEPCQTTCDTFVESPIARGITETGDSLEITDEVIVKEEFDKNHRLKWERGEIDYMGTDSFDNILAKLNAALLSVNDQNRISNSEE